MKQEPTQEGKRLNTFQNTSDIALDLLRFLRRGEWLRLQVRLERSFGGSLEGRDFESMFLFHSIPQLLIRKLSSSQTIANVNNQKLRCNYFPPIF